MAEAQLSDRICSLLLEFSAGNCSITDEMIEEESDENTAAILTGLTLLWEDLQYQADRRTAAEEELRQREARFRALFGQARVPIWDCDLADLLRSVMAIESDIDEVSTSTLSKLFGTINIRNVNNQTLALFGATDLDDFSSRLAELVDEASVPMLRRMFSELATGKRQLEVSGLLKTLNQSTVHVVMGLTTASATSGDLSQAIITVSDVTAQHRAHEAAAELANIRADELRRVSTEVERLFHAVSHDLRAPLRGVVNLAEWAHEDLKSGDLDEVHNHLDMLTSRVTRLETMLTDLLNYARVGRAKHPVEQVDVAVLLEEIRTVLVVMPDGFELEWTDMPVLETQKTLLGQVLQNLVSNALKHHHEKTGRIQVSHRRQDRLHEFSVADDGPGIPEAYRKKIFDMFSTLKPRDEVEGSGMGLAFVHKVIAKAGGSIHVSETPGGGATFTFTWPIEEA